MQAKSASKHTRDGLPGNSLTSLLADLGALTLVEAALPETPDHRLPLQARAPPLQQEAFDSLRVDPARFVATSVRA